MITSTVRVVLIGHERVVSNVTTLDDWVVHVFIRELIVSVHGNDEANDVVTHVRLLVFINITQRVYLVVMAFRVSVIIGVPGAQVYDGKEEP